MMAEHYTGFGVCLDDHLVIDIDPRNGGNESYDKLVKDFDIDFKQDCGYMVNTGGGGYHLYYKCPNVAMSMTTKEYPGIDFKSGVGKGSFVVGCGSIHASGGYYEKERGYPQDVNSKDAPQTLIDFLLKKDSFKVSDEGVQVEVSADEIKDMLKHIPADLPHDEWIKIGMAVHHATDGKGYALWDEWSAQDAGYPGYQALKKRWSTFGKNYEHQPATIGSLKKAAYDHGWVESVTFTPPPISDEEQKAVDDYIRHDLHDKVSGYFDDDSDDFYGDRWDKENRKIKHLKPIDIRHVDLSRPPGLVGRVHEWIDSQCSLRRDKLSVAGALTVVSMACGPRFTVDHRTTANNFMFGLAGSSSGKNAVMNAQKDLLEAIGLGPTRYSNIKSEQAIIRSMLDHQQVNLILDEAGLLLGKINSAKKSGAASYLEGIPKILMEAYSQADGIYDPESDMKRDIKEGMIKEAAFLRKKVESNEDKTGKYKRQLDVLEDKLDRQAFHIERPMITLMGISTPETFNNTVSLENVQSGFIGRSLIVNEYEACPDEKDGFRKAPMPSWLVFELSSLRAGPDGVPPPGDGRIEYTGPRHNIELTQKAEALLVDISEFFQRMRIRESRRNLQAIPGRGREITLKVALSLAVGEADQLMTEEHLLWAFALVKDDIDFKLNLANQNISAEGSNRGEELLARITTKLSPTDFISAGRFVADIKNKRFTKEHIKQGLDELVKRKRVEKRVRIAGNGKQCVEFRLIREL